MTGASYRQQQAGPIPVRAFAARGPPVPAFTMTTVEALHL